METTPRDFDALLAQAGWAKALARHLVRDPDRADDLVQRAWLAAMRRPPADGTPPRRWLATVMRNFVRQDARASSRREQREHAVARPDFATATDAIDDAAALQVRLIAAVRELPEPSRSTVWARYYDGLAPREIAARDGVPVDTVKTRLARGLDALRKRFDREHGGDRRAWVALLLPLTAEPSVTSPTFDPTGPSTPLATTTLATLVMNAKFKIAILVALVLCGSGLWISTRIADVPTESATFAAPLTTAEVAAPARVEPAPVEELPGESRAVIEAPPESVSAPVVVAADRREGRVLDLEKRPVAGLEIRDSTTHAAIVVDGAPLTSDASGKFLLPEAHIGQVTAGGAGWVTLFATQSDADTVCLIVARERTIAGSVVDADDHPVAGATVGFYAGESVRRGLSDVMRRPIELGFETHSAADGTFRIPDAPDAVGSVHARAQNRRSGSTRAPSGPVADLVVVMPAPEEGSIFLRGRVVEFDGSVVSTATVGIADACVTTDADGRFELPVLRSALDAAQRTTRDGRPPAGPMPLMLRAMKEGHLPARVQLPELEELERIAPTEEFQLELGGVPLSLSGRIVDSEGEPVEGAQISLMDEDPFGAIDMEFGGMTVNGHMSVEQFLRGGFSAGPIRSDASGLFTISGLQERDYRLDIEATSQMAALRTEPLRAGRDDVEIRIDTSGPRRRVAGRVVDRRGDPIGGVRVCVQSIVPGSDQFVSGTRTTADAEGRFAVEGVRGAPRRVEVIGGAVDLATVDVHEDDPLDDLVVTVSRRAFVQVDLSSRTDLADTARFLDLQGQEVQLHFSRATTSGTSQTSILWGSSTMSLTLGRSEVGSTAEGEYVCVLQKAGVEVMRIPVSLGGEGTTIVRP